MDPYTRCAALLKEAIHENMFYFPNNWVSFEARADRLSPSEVIDFYSENYQEIPRTSTTWIQKKQSLFDSLDYDPARSCVDLLSPNRKFDANFIAWLIRDQMKDHLTHRDWTKFSKNGMKHDYLSWMEEQLEHNSVVYVHKQTGPSSPIVRGDIHTYDRVIGDLRSTGTPRLCSLLTALRDDMTRMKAQHNLHTFIQ